MDRGDHFVQDLICLAILVSRSDDLNGFLKDFEGYSYFDQVLDNLEYYYLDPRAAKNEQIEKCLKLNWIGNSLDHG